MRLRKWGSTLCAALLAVSLLAASVVPLTCCPQDAGVRQSVSVAGQDSDCGCVCTGAACACHHGVGVAKLAERDHNARRAIGTQVAIASYSPPPAPPTAPLLRPPRA